jgi:phenol hydroxylase P5 protein
MDFERDEGKVLPCCARPRSDVTIEAEIDVDEDLEIFPVQDYAGTVVSLEDIARDTKRMVIELDRDMDFNAGQYLKFQVPDAGVDRTYSIASLPTEKRLLEFHIRRTAGGVATDGWIFRSLAVGDQMSVSGPYGRFVLHVGDDRPAVFVAGGTGLAPIKSMIRHALENNAYDGHLTLYQGARTQEWLYDVEEFQRLEKEYPDRFTYRPCLSEETAEGFSSGLVTAVIEAENDTLRGHAGYLCGPPPMVDAALKTLMGKRLFPRDIYREDFFNEGDKAAGGVRSPLIKR